MSTARPVGIALLLCLSTLNPAYAAIVQRSGDNMVVLDNSRQPISGVNVDIVSTDGSFKTQGFTNAEGSLCVLGKDNTAIAQGRPGCLYLPDGEYQLFVTDQAPVRFSVREGVLNIAAAATAPAAAAKSSSGAKTAWIAGGALVGVAALAGGGGGGGSNDEEPVEPADDVAVSVAPQSLEGEFEFGVSPCPTVIGELDVTNTGDIDARITVVPLEGISTTGQGQLVAVGDTATVTVLFNCLVISAIAGTIEVGLTADGQADSDTIEIVVDFK